MQGNGELFAGQKKLTEALSWLNEGILLEASLAFCNPPFFGWHEFHINHQSHVENYISLLMGRAEIFETLGNSGSCAFHSWQVNALFTGVLPNVDEKILEQKFKARLRLQEIAVLRHPDPKASMQVQDKDLQVRASWKKINLPKTKMRSRLYSATWFWNGCLYVLGGETQDGDTLSDLWYVDVVQRDGWHQLQSCAIRQAGLGKFVGLYKNVAYVFCGSSRIIHFNLKTEEWGCLNAKPQNFYPFDFVIDGALVMVQQKMYIFGGVSKTMALGCDLFISLDLETLEWEKLSGKANGVQEPTWDHPGPRRNSAMWVNKDGTQIHLLFGEADRNTAKRENEAFGALLGYAYRDL
ncbi:hypothetical protein C8J56DRAFT_1058512 [Mycena floridula]|nr:hypothetical protein C8J56DRAFT_1058512 [Mycena floridula]